MQYGEKGLRVEGVELVGGGAVPERVSTRTARSPRLKPHLKLPPVDAAGIS